MTGKLVEMVQRWPAVAEDDRGELEEAIGREARAIAARAAMSGGLADDAAQDVAQATADKFLRLLRGREVPQAPEAYVWRMAENCTRDVYRARKREAEGKGRLAEEASARSDDTPESHWLHEESRARAQELVARALEAAPENYRQVIRRHELDGEPIEQLAEERFEAMCAAGEVDLGNERETARARKKARNLVDQHLARGREWLRKRLAASLVDEELP